MLGMEELVKAEIYACMVAWMIVIVLTVISTFKQLVEDDVSLQDMPSSKAIVDVDAGAWPII